MSDDDLRRLEREATNDPAARLKLAHALERAGRPVEALAALLVGNAGITARTLDGHPLWTWRVPPRRRILQLAPLPGRLTLSVGTRAVVCLEEPS